MLPITIKEKKSTRTVVGPLPPEVIAKQQEEEEKRQNEMSCVVHGESISPELHRLRCLGAGFVKEWNAENARSVSQVSRGVSETTSRSGERKGLPSINHNAATFSEWSDADAQSPSSRSISGARDGKDDPKPSEPVKEYTGLELKQNPSLQRLQFVLQRIQLAEKICHRAIKKTCRKPRSDAERLEKLLFTEQLKTILFVGRRFNLVERIETILAAAEEARARNLPYVVGSTDSTENSTNMSKPSFVLNSVKLNLFSEEKQLYQEQFDFLFRRKDLEKNDFDIGALEELTHRISDQEKSIVECVHPNVMESIQRNPVEYGSYDSNFKEICWLIESLDLGLFMDDIPLEKPSVLPTVPPKESVQEPVKQHAETKDCTETEKYALKNGSPEPLANVLFSPTEDEDVQQGFNFSITEETSKERKQKNAVQQGAGDKTFMTAPLLILKAGSESPEKPRSTTLLSVRKDDFHGAENEEPSIVGFSLSLNDMSEYYYSLSTTQMRPPRTLKKKEKEELNLLGFMYENIPHESAADRFGEVEETLSQENTTAGSTLPIPELDQHSAVKEDSPLHARTPGLELPLDEESAEELLSESSLKSATDISLEEDATAAAEDLINIFRLAATDKKLRNVLHFRPDILVSMQKLYRLHNYTALIDELHTLAKARSGRSEEEWVADIEEKIRRQMLNRGANSEEDLLEGRMGGSPGLLPRGSKQPPQSPHHSDHPHSGLVSPSVDDLDLCFTKSPSSSATKHSPKKEIFNDTGNDVLLEETIACGLRFSVVGKLSKNDTVLRRGGMLKVAPGKPPPYESVDIEVTNPTPLYVQARVKILANKLQNLSVPTMEKDDSFHGVIGIVPPQESQVLLKMELKSKKNTAFSFKDAFIWAGRTATTDEIPVENDEDGQYYESIPPVWSGDDDLFANRPPLQWGMPTDSPLKDAILNNMNALSVLQMGAGTKKSPKTKKKAGGEKETGKGKKSKKRDSGKATGLAFRPKIGGEEEPGSSPTTPSSLQHTAGVADTKGVAAEKARLAGKEKREGGGGKKTSVSNKSGLYPPSTVGTGKLGSGQTSAGTGSRPGSTFATDLLTPTGVARGPGITSDAGHRTSVGGAGQPGSTGAATDLLAPTGTARGPGSTGDSNQLASTGSAGRPGSTTAGGRPPATGPPLKSEQGAAGKHSGAKATSSPPTEFTPYDVDNLSSQGYTPIGTSKDGLLVLRDANNKLFVYLKDGTIVPAESVGVTQSNVRPYTPQQLRQLSASNSERASRKGANSASAARDVDSFSDKGRRSAEAERSLASSKSSRKGYREENAEADFSSHKNRADAEALMIQGYTVAGIDSSGRIVMRDPNNRLTVILPDGAILAAEDVGVSLDDVKPFSKLEAEGDKSISLLRPFSSSSRKGLLSAGTSPPPSVEVWRGGERPPPMIAITSRSSRPHTANETSQFQSIGGIRFDIDDISGSTDTERQTGNSTSGTRSPMDVRSPGVLVNTVNERTKSSRKSPLKEAQSFRAEVAKRKQQDAAALRARSKDKLTAAEAKNMVRLDMEEKTLEQINEEMMQNGPHPVHVARSPGSRNVNVFLPSDVRDSEERLLKAALSSLGDADISLSHPSSEGKVSKADTQVTDLLKNAARRASQDRKGSRKKSVQQRTDISSLEDQAKELYLLDPTRYNEVIDDLVRMAAEKFEEGSKNAVSPQNVLYVEGQSVTRQDSKVGYLKRSASSELESEADQSGFAVPNYYSLQASTGSSPQCVPKQRTPTLHKIEVGEGILPKDDMSMEQSNASTSMTRDSKSANQRWKSRTSLKPASTSGGSSIVHEESELEQQDDTEVNGSSTLPSARYEGDVYRGKALPVKLSSFLGIRRKSEGNLLQPTSLTDPNKLPAIAEAMSQAEMTEVNVFRRSKRTPNAQPYKLSKVVLELPDKTENAVEAGQEEVERIMFEQMRAKLLLNAVVGQLKSLWESRQNERERDRLIELDQQMREAQEKAWQLGRKRIINVNKIIHLADRKTGRVGGWIPVYTDSNVFVDQYGYPSQSMVQRRIINAMRLARHHRLLPMHLVRRDVEERWNAHLLFGYTKRVVTLDDLNFNRASIHGRLPAYKDMRNLAERLRYRRRLQRAAPFQRPSAMYSPRTYIQYDFPYTRKLF